MHARERLWGGKSGGSRLTRRRAPIWGISPRFSVASSRPTIARGSSSRPRSRFFIQVIQTTLLMSRQLASPVPKLLLFVVVGWSALLFLSFRPAQPVQSRQRRRGGAGLDRGRERHLHDPRVQPALFRPLPHFAGWRRQPDRYARPLKALRPRLDKAAGPRAISVSRRGCDETAWVDLACGRTRPMYPGPARSIARRSAGRS